MTATAVQIHSRRRPRKARPARFGPPRSANDNALRPARVNWLWLAAMGLDLAVWLCAAGVLAHAFGLFASG